MPVFKAYFIVVKKNLLSLLVFFSVFIFMTIIFVKFAGEQTSFDFAASKTNMVLQSQEHTILTDGLTAYLETTANIVDVGTGENSVQDALFFGKADYVLTIPAGFTESFISGKDTITLEKITGAQSTSAVNMDLLLNKYLTLARLYLINVPGISQSELVTNVSNDIANTVPVVVTASSNQTQTGGISDSFRYMGYAVLSIMLMGIVSIMMAFNEPEVSRRNLCAPVKPMKLNLSLFAGNAIFMVVLWLLLCVVAFIINGQWSMSGGVLLMCLNALVFSICGLSIAFLAGKFVKSEIALAAVTNIVSLGCSFLSGIFVPQFLLGDNILKIASLTPTYWYVKAIGTIKDLPEINLSTVKPVIGDMLIQLAFAAACIIIALVASKQRRQNTLSL